MNVIAIVVSLKGVVYDAFTLFASLGAVVGNNDSCGGRRLAAPTCAIISGD